MYTVRFTEILRQKMYYQSCTEKKTDPSLKIVIKNYYY